MDIVAQNVNVGLSMKQNLKAELIGVLVFGSFTHSRLKFAVPDRGTKFSKQYSVIFDEVLNEVIL